MNAFVNFLIALGFTEPRQTSRKDVVELVVLDDLKQAHKKLRSDHLKFLRITRDTTPNSTVQEFYAVQNKQTVGRVRMESFAAHSVIQLTNLGE